MAAACVVTFVLLDLQAQLSPGETVLGRCRGEELHHGTVRNDLVPH